MPINNEAFGQILKNGGSLADLITGGNQARQTAQQQQQLDIGKYGAEQGQDVNTIKKLKDAGLSEEGGQVKAGGISTGADPYARMYGMQMAGTQKAYQQANSIYDKGVPDISKQLMSLEELHNITNDPNNVNAAGQAKTKIINAMGMQRFNEQEAKQAIMNTYGQQFGDTINKMFSNTGGNTLGEDDIRSINSLGQAITNSIKSTHLMNKERAINNYRGSNFYDPHQEQALRDTLGAPVQQRIDSLSDAFSKVPNTSNKAQIAAQQQPGMGSRIMNGLGSLFGPSQQQPQQAAPQQQQAPAPQQQPDYRALAQQELMKRKQAQPKGK